MPRFLKYKAAMTAATLLARTNDKVYYVFRIGEQFRVSNEYDSNWLFKAYPGGRKIDRRVVIH
jgi:hypothetical protein